MGRRKSTVPELLQRFNDIQTPMMKGEVRLALLESGSSDEDENTYSRYQCHHQHGNTQASSWNGKTDDTDTGTGFDTDMDDASDNNFNVKPSMVQQSIEAVFPEPKSTLVHSMSAQAKKHRARRAKLRKDALTKKEDARKGQFKMSSTNNRAHQVPFLPSRPELAREFEATVKAVEEDDEDEVSRGPTPSPITSPSRSSASASTPAPRSRSAASTKFTLISPTLLADLRSSNDILRSHNLSLEQRRREAEDKAAAERFKMVVLATENEELRGQVALLRECGIEWARRVEMLKEHVRGLVREKETWEERGVDVKAAGMVRAEGRCEDGIGGSGDFSMVI